MYSDSMLWHVCTLKWIVQFLGGKLLHLCAKDAHFLYELVAARRDEGFSSSLIWSQCSKSQWAPVGLWAPPLGLSPWMEKSPRPSNSVHSANWWRESRSSVGKSRSARCWMNLFINWITWILKSLLFILWSCTLGTFSFFCLRVFQESRVLWCLIYILCVIWVDF